jgi:hypothetical protein
MATGGRITCPKCGSNNFDTVSVCWKCSNPLSAAAAAQMNPQPQSSSAQGPSYAAPTYTAPAQGGFVNDMAYRAVSVAGTLGDQAKANRAAFWLGMLFPYFGFPIGLAFMMCDDARKQEVGRLCILWSCLSGVVHLLLMFVSLLGMRTMFAAMLGGLRGGLNSSSGGEACCGKD